MEKNPIVIVSATRTPVGNFQGALQNVAAPALGGIALKAASAKAGLTPEAIQEVFMGCVLPAGLGQAPARQAMIAAGLPYSVGATTVNKVCGSGMKAIMLAHDLALINPESLLLAGGMENMSKAPYLSLNGRAGFRLGHTELKDHMLYDGLEDAYQKDTLMGLLAEACADLYQFTREAQDEFAINSVKKAQKAQTDNAFDAEITPVTFQSRQGEVLIAQDEGPANAKLEKIPLLRPAFRKDGTVTAANSSSISDGAAAVALMSLAEATRRGLKPLAQIVAHHTHSQDPTWFTTAPVGAIQGLLSKLGWKSTDVDLYEINEAFAVVTMAAIHDLQLDPAKVNIHGGACILGHPIGASGARIVVTLIHALQRYKLKRGIAALCIGGGEATALAIETI